MEIRWYIKKIICKNGIEERTKYPVRSEYEGGVRAKREARRGFARVDNAVRQLARIFNNNYQVRKDVHIVLTYTDSQIKQLERSMAEMADVAEEDKLIMAAKRDFDNYIRRCKRALKDIEIKYVRVTSDIDGKTGAVVRVHHHFIVNSEAEQVCKTKWRGIVLYEELYNVNGDMSALAEYLIRQTRPVGNSKRYTPSRNLEQPYEEEPILLVGNAARFAESEMRVPKGCRLLYRSTYARGASQYIRYFRPGGGGIDNGDKV